MVDTHRSSDSRRIDRLEIAGEYLEKARLEDRKRHDERHSEVLERIGGLALTANETSEIARETSAKVGELTRRIDGLELNHRDTGRHAALAVVADRVTAPIVVESNGGRFVVNKPRVKRIVEVGGLTTIALVVIEALRMLAG